MNRIRLYTIIPGLIHNCTNWAVRPERRHEVPKSKGEISNHPSFDFGPSLHSGPTLRTNGYLSIFLSFLLAFPLSADPLRQEITDIRKQKEALIAEQKKLMKERDEFGKMIQDLAGVYEEKKESQTELQLEISKNLPLLARLKRSNPLHLLVDPTSGPSKERGIILMRFLVSSIKNKMQKIKIELMDIKNKENDLILKNQQTLDLLQKIEQQTTQLTEVENQKIEAWKKAELARLDKEDDANTLLDESRSAFSSPTKAAAAAAAAQGLPFRKLEQPVVGKSFQDATLQNRFSPHSQGLFFESKRNAKVCAPAKGKVVFKGPFRNHAEILIIDHGESAHTILMGMHKIDAEVGKKVYTGQKLGTMAGYGSGHPHLYLELRHKGECIDPRPYFVMKNLE